MEHTHQWVDIEIGCEDHGTHPALECEGDGLCPDTDRLSALVRLPIDLIYQDDPRQSDGH